MANRKLKTILGLLAALVVMGIASVAMADPQQVAETVQVQKASPEYLKWVAVAAGFGIALAAFGGALAQGRTASTALDGIARNPNAADKLFTPMILGLALIESLVIYALIISFLLLGKL